MEKKFHLIKKEIFKSLCFLKYNKNKKSKLYPDTAYRESFKKIININLTTLEIGPFNNPIVRGENVEYFDVLPKEELENRADQFGLKTTNIPFIHHVHSSGDLSIIKGNFDQIVSAHLIEHQPCLVTHLNNIEKLLSNNGKYFLIIPDKRYCFDHFNTETTIADVLQAYHEKRVQHTLSSVLEHRALIAHNDPIRHWSNDHGVKPSAKEISITIQNATDEYYQAGGNYIDVHAWQFTPENFGEIIKILNNLKLSKLKTKLLNQTPHGRFEFTAILEK